MLKENIQELPHLKSSPETKSEYTSVVLSTPGKTEIKKLELKAPEKDQVRIKLEGSGVCASNLPVWEGREWFKYPISAGEPGHEGWGIIDAVGDEVSEFKVGERVTGLTYHAYATHDFARPENLVRLPDFLDGKAFPGEPLGCAINIFSRSDIKEGQTVAIIGCGFLGLLLIQLAKSAGAKVIAVSRREFSLKAALHEGADYTIVMDDHQKIIEKVAEITENTLCDRVIECTGKEWPLNLSIELTKIKGKLIVAGFHQDGMRKVNVQMLNWRGIDMISAHERDNKEYLKGIGKAVEAVKNDQLNPFHLFTHRFGLEDMETAYTCLQERPDGFIKALVITDQF